MTTVALHDTVESASRPRDSFHLALAVAMTVTAYVGFSFTYFGPLFAGVYPRVSPLVHVHGISFLLWYLLLPLQAGLVRTRHVSLHRRIGLTSLALGSVMVLVGFIVSVVGMHRALQPDGDPFWRLMGLPIFSIWALFTTFYGTAMVQRKRRVYHRQFIVLASATALTAATFRVLVRFIGFTPEIAVAGCFAPLLFVAAAAVHEYRRQQAVSWIHVWGGVAMIVIIGAAFALSIAPGAGSVERTIAWIGEHVQPLYVAP